MNKWRGRPVSGGVHMSTRPGSSLSSVVRLLREKEQKKEDKKARRAFNMYSTKEYDYDISVSPQTLVWLVGRIGRASLARALGTSPHYIKRCINKQAIPRKEWRWPVMNLCLVQLTEDKQSMIKEITKLYETQ